MGPAAKTILAAVVVVAVAAAGVWAVRSRGTDVGMPGPEAFVASAWLPFLSGEEDQLEHLNNPSTSALSPEMFNDAAQVAAQVTLAEVTGEGRDRFGSYWPESWWLQEDRSPLPGADVCTDATVSAVNPQRLWGRDRWVKALVVWDATCPYGAVSESPQRYSFVYLSLEPRGWTPVRPGSIPHVPDLEEHPPLPEFALGELGACAGSGATLQARVEVVAAFESMCNDAAASQVALTVSAAHRTAAQQQRLWGDAVRFYGGELEAARYVSPSDGSRCDSAHCEGLALDVPGQAAQQWLRAQVCVIDGVEMRAEQCPDGQARPRMERYGFVAPFSISPDKIKFVLPVADLGEAPQCNPSAGRPVASIIAEVWRCRLAAAGVVHDEAEAVVATALVVARCESGWAPGFVQFNGRYAATPRPEDGERFDGVGLFALPLPWMEVYLRPDQRASDPIAASDAAVRLYLDERAAGRSGWDVFSCAAGREALGVTSVLPSAGGGDLPQWAFDY